jgi:hypothetical protein
MFPALICSSSGGTVYTAIGTFCAYYVGWQLPPDDEQNSAGNM